MKPNDLAKLEEDNRFKKKYLPKNFWLKVSAIYPPAGVLFIALFGLIYLLNYDMLISVYAVPFVVLLLLGAIWLKAVRRYILQKLFEKENTFLVCVGEIAEEKDGWLYAVFTTSSRRHDERSVENMVKILNKNIENISGYFASFGNPKKETIALPAGDVRSENVYVRAFTKGDADKAYIGWRNENILPLLYIDDKKLLIIKGKDLKF